MKGIYLIQCEGTNCYKIGTYSNNIKVRLTTLQIGCPFRLLLIHAEFSANAENTEKYLHKRWKEQNIRGEWFELFKDDIKEIIEDMKTLAISEEPDWDNPKSPHSKKSSSYGKLTKWWSLTP